MADNRDRDTERMRDVTDEQLRGRAKDEDEFDEVTEDQDDVDDMNDEADDDLF